MAISASSSAAPSAAVAVVSGTSTAKTGGLNGAESANSAVQNGDFSHVLSGTLTDEGGSSGTADNNIVAELMASMNPMLLGAKLPQADLKSASPEQAISALLAELQQNPGLLMDLTEDPDFQNWLQQAQALLASLQTVGQPAHAVETIVLPAAPDNVQVQAGAAPQDPFILLKEIKDVLNQLLSQLHTGQDNKAVQQLGQSLKALLSNPSNDWESALREKLLQSLGELKATGAVQAFEDRTMLVTDRQLQIIPAKEKNGATASEIPVRSFASVKIASVKPAAASSAAVLSAFPTEPAADGAALLSKASGELAAPSEGNSSISPMPLQDQGRQSLIKAVIPASNGQQLTEEMTQFVVKQFKITQLGGWTEAKITLTPEHLGQVDVKLSMHNGQLVAQFVAENAAGKDLLENQLPQLRASLQNQGIQVDKLEVSQGQLQTNLFMGNRQSSSQQFTRQQNKNRGNESYDQISAQLASEVISLNPASSQLHGGSIDVTA